MKKITILLSASVFLASITSCTKDPVTQPGSTIGTPPPTPPSNEVKLVSTWFALSPDSINNRSNAYLTGRYGFETNEKYDRSNHVELAYVRISRQRTAEYKKLPMKYTFSQDKMYSFSSSMDQFGFVLTILNLKEPNEFPDASAFADFRYRYIVISKNMYNSLNIDWDDYAAVAQALNI